MPRENIFKIVYLRVYGNNYLKGSGQKVLTLLLSISGFDRSNEWIRAVNTIRCME